MTWTGTSTSTITFAMARWWRAIAIRMVMRAVEERLRIGTLFGMPHGMELELADEICARFPVEMVRFGNSGSEVTLYAISWRAR